MRINVTFVSLERLPGSGVDIRKTRKTEVDLRNMKTKQKLRRKRRKEILDEDEDEEKYPFYSI